MDQIRSENVEFSKTRTLPAEKPDLDNLAYVVYSSGSTGKPKGKKNIGVELEYNLNMIIILLFLGVLI